MFMRNKLRLQCTLLALAVCGVASVSAWQLRHGQVFADESSVRVHSRTGDTKSAASEAAFMQVWKVFTSPRCQNCHPAGDAPLQGDDSHVHTQNVKRGAEGHGVTAMKCATCHQDKNLRGANMPPGNPRWGLPPANNKMVFVGRTPGELCRQLKDPAQTGGRNPAQLVEHVASDDLVAWGWDPGEGRTLPPLNRADTAAAMRTWIDNGAACPTE
jgi:hypothetical protein